jgi:hypothetical protein
VFDILLSLDSAISRVEYFEIDELVDSISRRESLDQSVLVFVNTAYEIISNTDVDGAAWTARKNIDIVLLQGLKFPEVVALASRVSSIGIAGTSPAMTAERMAGLVSSI